MLDMDGRNVPFARHDDERPGLLRATVDVAAGDHTLTLRTGVDRPTSVSISTRDLELAFPSLHGDHPRPGERTLLADLVPGWPATTRAITALTLRSGAYFATLDLGRTRHGRLTFAATGPSGAVLDIGMSERLCNGRPLPYAGPRYAPMSQVDSFVLGAERRKLSTIDARAGRYVLLIGYSPEGPIELSDVRFVEELYPVVLLGSFRSPNDRLNEIWRVGAGTVGVNMLDAYADPWRERGQWWGDAYVIDQVNRVSFGDTRLLRRGVEAMANAFGDDGHPAALAPNNDGSHLLDYGMLWVQSLTRYAQLQSDDDAFVERMYGTASTFVAYLSTFHAEGTHLIELPERHWSENGVIDWPAYYSRNGLSAAMNALYARTLRELGVLANRLGHETDAAEYEERAEQVAGELNEMLLVDGRYKATWLDGELVDAISPHAQAWPLSAGIVPDNDRDSVADSALELLADDPTDANIGTYGMYWLLDALAAADRYDESLEIIETYYGFMLDRGATTWWESFTADDDWSQSMSHGWAAAPTWFLSTRVLGAEQTGPGTWHGTPAFAGLEAASGAVPGDGAPLRVAWSGSRDPCRARSVTLDVPAGTRGAVHLRAVPRGAPVRLDGEFVRPDQSGPLATPAVARSEPPLGFPPDTPPETKDVLVDVSEPGRHLIEVSSNCE